MEAAADYPNMCHAVGGSFLCNQLKQLAGGAKTLVCII